MIRSFLLTYAVLGVFFAGGIFGMSVEREKHCTNAEMPSALDMAVTVTMWGPAVVFGGVGWIDDTQGFECARRDEP